MITGIPKNFIRTIDSIIEPLNNVSNGAPVDVANPTIEG